MISVGLLSPRLSLTSISIIVFFPFFPEFCQLTLHVLKVSCRLSRRFCGFVRGLFSELCWLLADWLYYVSACGQRCDHPWPRDAASGVRATPSSATCAASPRFSWRIGAGPAPSYTFQFTGGSAAREGGPSSPGGRGLCPLCSLLYQGPRCCRRGVLGTQSFQVTSWLQAARLGTVQARGSSHVVPPPPPAELLPGLQPSLPGWQRLS